LISKYCTPIQNGYQLIWKYFSQVPIAQTNNSIGRKIENTVDKIINAKKKDLNADVSKDEKQVDCLVYKLYNLAYSEASLIEGNKEWMKEEEYNRFEITKTTINQII